MTFIWLNKSTKINVAIWWSLLTWQPLTPGINLVNLCRTTIRLHFIFNTSYVVWQINVSFQQEFIKLLYNPINAWEIIDPVQSVHPCSHWSLMYIPFQYSSSAIFLLNGRAVMGGWMGQIVLISYVLIGSCDITLCVHVCVLYLWMCQTLEDNIYYPFLPLLFIVPGTISHKSVNLITINLELNLMS